MPPSFLLFEDDEVVGEILAARLKRGGHSVHFARSVSEAFGIIQSQEESSGRYFVLVDLDRPDLNCPELVRLICLHARATIGVIMMSSLGPLDQRCSEGMDLLESSGHVSVLLSKPFTIGQLDSAIEHVLVKTARPFEEQRV